MTGTRLGDWGESVAARHLEAKGWEVLDRKFRIGRKEIDLVARRGEVVAFVEVKTRRGTRRDLPFEAIGERKRARIAVAAAGWLGRFGAAAAGRTYRFDAVAVTRGRDGAVSIEHLEDAWRPGADEG